MSLGKLTVLCTLCIFGLSQTDQSCPKFDPWLPWTDQCVWFPLNQMRQQMVDACQLKYSFSNRLPQIQWPKNFTKPDPCGFCSFKFRCHKRSRTDGCMTFEGEKKTCGQYSQICQLPMHPTYGCRWNTVVDSIKFCLNQESIPDWKRTEYMKLYSMLPEKNCMEKDGQCRCCCHPYVPNPTGTGCVLQPMTPEHQCTKFGSFNDWSSQCFWFPVSDMVSQFATHCGIDTVKDLPSGFVTAGTVKDKQNEYKAPERCGYCSFRARCRKRTPKSGCFSFNAEKKVCGEDDCKTCHQPCIMPTLTSGTTVTNHSSCDWQSAVMARYGDKMKQIQQSPTIPYVRKHGIQQLFKHMPRGTCQRFGDHCKCCCEPYIPSADGTECVLNDFCSKNY